MMVGGRDRALFSPAERGRMKQGADFFGDKELELVYIAKRLRDALKLEGVLTEHGVDYAVEPDTYRGGFIFQTQRVGAFFYVAPESLESVRHIMTEHGWKPLEPEK